MIAFVDTGALARECFTRIFEAEHPGVRVEAFGSVTEWRQASTRFAAVACSIGQGSGTVSIGKSLEELVGEAAPVPVVALVDTDNIDVLTAAVKCGVSGCIPISIGIDPLIHAVMLISSGCLGLPAATFSNIRRDVEAEAVGEPPACLPHLSPRQRTVAEALVQGKSNKLIAKDLNICENTVKVHIRAIMVKLGVRNRTAAAFKLSAGSSQGMREPRGRLG